MSSIIRYKGYWTKPEVDMGEGIIHGKIEGIKDLITFECESVRDIQSEFESAVDDYEAFCKEEGKEPEKPFTGSFNVRIDPELHKASAMAAADDKMTLNAFVTLAIKEKLNAENSARSFPVPAAVKTARQNPAGMQNL